MATAVVTRPIRPADAPAHGRSLLVYLPTAHAAFATQSLGGYELASPSPWRWFRCSGSSL
jgi:hypothetical protein